MALSYARRHLDWGLGTISALKEWLALAQAAQRVGITISGGVWETWECGTEGCRQWAQWDGWVAGVGLGDLRGHFQPE